jgi:hypothetical protein
LARGFDISRLDQGSEHQFDWSKVCGTATLRMPADLAPDEASRDLNEKIT